MNRELRREHGLGRRRGCCGKVLCGAGWIPGLFGELGAHAIGHSGQFRGNDSNLNFLISAGVGWQFANDLFVVARFEHISNADISHHNAATNLVALGLGYRF